MKKVLLRDLAFARSGDKGDVCNVGIMAKSKNIYDFLVKALTPAKIKKHYKGMIKGNVEIYPMPNIHCLEVVLRQSLGGGATCTLRFDQTGKSMCGAMLRMEVEADESLIKEAKKIDKDILKKYGS
jgi:phosphoribosylaminoimidazole-succinocarboxamide synthase